MSSHVQGISGYQRPNIIPRYILRPRILCTSDQCFCKIEETCRSNYHCKSLKEFLLSPKPEHYQKYFLRCTKLSFIQLGGGIATGVYQQQKKLYSLTATPEMWVRRNISLGVRTITLRVCSQLFTSDNYPADVEFWERPLRYHYRGFHDLLCEPPTYCLSRSDFITYSAMAAFAI